MNCFLVRLRHAHDDLPLFVSADKEQAIAFAKDAPWQPQAAICNILFSPNVSMPVVIDVVEFRNGVPVEVIKVRDWDDEQSPVPQLAGTGF